MSERAPRVLAVDDDVAMCSVLEVGLGRRGFEVETCTSAQQAIERLGAHEYAVLLTDLQMPGVGGIALCTEAVAVRPGLPVVVITAFGSLESAIAAMRAGAYDFITKPFEVDVLAMALHRAAEYTRLKQDIQRLERQLADRPAQTRMLGQSPAMRRVFERLERTADSEVTVLITGESGTGKELVALALHDASPRRERAFVAVNCAALPEALLESELFGHARGAFTGAQSSRTGLIARAEGGTLFLDEIGELPLSVQAKLLRALQERVLRPVGSDQEMPFDVRVITATNRDLVAAVEDGRFRSDLYFRINVLDVHLPPLRDRGNDVLLLAQQHLESTAATTKKPVRGIAPDAAAKLRSYAWPGNVRELHNCIERAVALARFDHITLDDLPDSVRKYTSSHVLVVADSPSDFVALEEVEKRYILRVLDAAQGNRSVAARILGLDRKTLQRKLALWQGETE
ncbi:MAG TPA: sigma-54 dependent transcriptional regulator [Polyangiales bacterium]|nr:sigma-54 dependent transcriptional regulator [Polyangiales bacterium]